MSCKSRQNQFFHSGVEIKSQPVRTEFTYLLVTYSLQSGTKQLKDSEQGQNQTAGKMMHSFPHATFFFFFFTTGEGCLRLKVYVLSIDLQLIFEKYKMTQCLRMTIDKYMTKKAQKPIYYVLPQNIGKIGDILQQGNLKPSTLQPED